MAWNTRGLRGSTLEELLNLTHQAYLDKGLAVVQKISTPITPVKFDKATGTITSAYFEKKSTVDYIGVVQGIPICFDAKETTRNYLPFDSIHKHQTDFMQAFVKQEGLAFLLVYFVKQDSYFFLPFEQLKSALDSAEQGGRKSIPFEDFDPKYRLGNKSGFFVHYLEAINTYLNSKESEEQ